MTKALALLRQFGSLLQTLRTLPPAPPSPAEQDFAAAAAELINNRERARDRRMLHWVAGICGALLLWATIAQVDEVTRGEGKVVSSRSLQTVQSLDGGIVTAILVREGEVVEQGQVLLKIDETRAASGARENAAMSLSLQARVARLRALAEGTAFDPPKASDADDQRIVEEERRLFEMRRAELAGQ